MSPISLQNVGLEIATNVQLALSDQLRTSKVAACAD